MKTLSRIAVVLGTLGMFGCPVPMNNDDMGTDADMRTEDPDLACPGGSCVGPECTMPSDCTKDPMTTTPKCDTGINKCVSCSEHADCGTGGFCFKIGDCSTVPIPNLSGGQCIFANQFATVDAASGCSAAGPNYCNVAQAITAGKNYIKVAANAAAYPAVTVSSGNYVIFGSGGRLSTVTVTGGSVLLSNITIEPGAGSTAGIRCSMSAGKVCLQDSVVDNQFGMGVNADMCGQIEIARTRLTSYDHAITVSGSGASGSGGYRIVNTAVSSTTVGGSGAFQEGVFLGLNATGYFGFNTVTKYLRGISCSSSQPLEDSIVAANTNAQVTSCMTTRVVTTGVMLMSGLEPKLIDNAANNTCCIDKAMPNQAVTTDFYGTKRPARTGFDIGYHEVSP